MIGKNASEAVSQMMKLMREGTPYLKIDLPRCEPVTEFEARIITFLKVRSAATN